MLNVLAENGGIYQIMWKNTVEPEMPQMIV